MPDAIFAVPFTSMMISAMSRSITVPPARPSIPPLDDSRLNFEVEGGEVDFRGALLLVLVVLGERVVTLIPLLVIWCLEMSCDDRCVWWSTAGPFLRSIPRRSGMSFRSCKVGHCLNPGPLPYQYWSVA